MDGWMDRERERGRERGRERERERGREREREMHTYIHTSIHTYIHTYILRKIMWILALLRGRLHEPGLTGNPGAYINPGYKKSTFTWTRVACCMKPIHLTRVRCYAMRIHSIGLLLVFRLIIWRSLNDCLKNAHLFKQEVIQLSKYLCWFLGKERIIRVDPGRSNPSLYDLLYGFSHLFSPPRRVNPGLQTCYPARRVDPGHT